MKKLYVTVTDETYRLLENYLSSACTEFIGISKSSVVNSILYNSLSKISVFKDDLNFVPHAAHRCTFSLSNFKEEK